MGLGLSFAEGEGPRFARPLRDEREIQRLAVPDPDQLRYVFDTVARARRVLGGKVPLIGFAGSPFTLACYMVEGGPSTDFHHVKTMLYRRPELLRRILDVNARAVTAYLNAQIEAGAQVVMIFDTWGGALGHVEYREFSLAYMQQVLDGLVRERDGARVPNILFTKGGGAWLEAIAASGCDAVGVDWTVHLGAARERVGARVALQGNLEPAVLLADARAVRGGVASVLSHYGHGGGHVFNLGHGVSRFTPPENVAVVVEAVHEISRQYH
jgi:uroporphyrinogen decarboxylase